MKRPTVTQALSWVAQADALCAEAEQILIVEGGSSWSRKALALAMRIRQCAILRLEQARGLS